MRSAACKDAEGTVGPPRAGRPRAGAPTGPRGHGREAPPAGRVKGRGKCSGRGLCCGKAMRCGVPVAVASPWAWGGEALLALAPRASGRLGRRRRPSRAVGEYGSKAPVEHKTGQRGRVRRMLCTRRGLGVREAARGFVTVLRPRPGRRRGGGRACGARRKRPAARRKRRHAPAPPSRHATRVHSPQRKPHRRSAPGAGGGARARRGAGGARGGAPFCSV